MTKTLDRRRQFLTEEVNCEEDPDRRSQFLTKAFNRRRQFRTEEVNCEEDPDRRCQFLTKRSISSTLQPFVREGIHRFHTPLASCLRGLFLPSAFRTTELSLGCLRLFSARGPHLAFGFRATGLSLGCLRLFSARGPHLAFGFSRDRTFLSASHLAFGISHDRTFLPSALRTEGLLTWYWK